MTSPRRPGPPRCRVLLSTYNGTHFLREQVASVLSQEGVEIELHVRDDSSTDDTAELLELLEATDPRLTHELGEHLGPAHSFLTMLRDTPLETEYTALCDQDDVWKDGKLERATTWLDLYPGPAAYCSAVSVVDERLRPLGIHRTCRRGPALANALVQNVATGCTIVLNQHALPLFRKIPDHPVMHDAWIYAVVSAVGTVLYDPEPWVLYRQHESNSIGLAASPAAQWLRRVHQHVSQGSEQAHTRQAMELLDLLGPALTTDSRTVISNFVDSQRTLLKRFEYALVGPAFRQRRIDSVIYRLLYALGRI